MNVAYYLLAFDHASVALYEQIGVGSEQSAKQNRSMFAVDCQLTFQHELVAGDPIRIDAQLLAYDQKRIHFFLRMAHAKEGYLAATSEWLSLHVDLQRRRTVPFPPSTLAILEEIRLAHANLPIPPEVGRPLGVARKS